MEVSIETPGGLKRELRVRIPADDVAKAVDDRLKSMARRAKLPGFRPGKAPFKVIQQQYGASARLDAVTNLVNESYPKALNQAGVQPAGQPRIDITAETPGQPLEYVAHFEVFPQIELGGLDDLSIDKPVVEITDADIERLVLNLRKGRRTMNTVERAAAQGDMVKLDFEGKLDGEVFQGGKGDNVDVELGLGQFLPDLESGIAGHAAGETFEVPVSFPADYRAENLRGKTAQFTVNLKEVKEIVLPSVEDAEFLKAHGVETVEALREKGKGALENERAKAIRNRQKSQVMEQLLQKNPLEIPQALIDAEIPRVREQAAGRMNMTQLPPEKLAELLPAQLFQEQAKRRVALGLLLAEVIRKKEVKLDSARVEVALDQLSTDFEQPEQVKQYYRQQPQLMEGLRGTVLEDQVVEILLTAASQPERPMTLEQLLNPQVQSAA
jgi:trigger factor